MPLYAVVLLSLVCSVEFLSAQDFGSGNGNTNGNLQPVGFQPMSFQPLPGFGSSASSPVAGSAPVSGGSSSGSAPSPSRGSSINSNTDDCSSSRSGCAAPSPSSSSSRSRGPSQGGSSSPGASAPSPSLAGTSQSGSFGDHIRQTIQDQLNFQFNKAVQGTGTPSFGSGTSRSDN
ncbi:secreted protein C-like [Paramacrobiotus metropolitanus]|uniref:secreted protein C-like n=1 Tax=Paramacrobiotus metropolitanus TaxID=2943436 RepID=UPI002445BEB2|nr:secreted protein C-like [Paramacrobiotus metropolitanus]